MCGMVSNYSYKPRPMNNLRMITIKELQLLGFIVFTIFPKYHDQFFQDIPPMIKSGKLKYMEALTMGIELAGHAMLDVQLGNNFGKSVVIVDRDT
jgi:NADPH-dependent curcumin reductase CurA